MNKEMNRRLFLKLIPIAATLAAIAPTLNSEVLKPKSRKPATIKAPSPTEEEYLVEARWNVDPQLFREYLKRYG